MAFCAQFLLAVCVFAYNFQVGQTDPWKLSFLEEPADTQFAHTQYAFLRCKVAGNPPPVISWRLATSFKTILSTNTSLRYVLRNGSLFFPSFQEKELDPSVHQASYQCVARNKLGAIVSRRATLRAVVVKSYHVRSMDTNVMLGGTAVIKAVYPKSIRHYVKVKSWYKGRNKVVIGGRFSLMPSGDLIITSVRREDADQMYYCYTANVLTGETKASNPAKISVQAQKEKPAYMTSDVFNITVTTGNHAELQCTAGGYPAPQYSWSKRNRGEVTMGGRFSLHAGGSLRIERVTVDDSGLYTCTATNSGQTVVSTILLEVRVPLAFRIRPQPRAEQIGTISVIFKCDVTGEPRPNITWYRNIEPIPKEERIDIDQDHKLTLSVVYSKDIGVYQCVADNGLEMVQSSAEFFTVRKPSIWESSFQEQILNPGENLDLSCKVPIKYRVRKITWYLDNQQLHDGEDFKITEQLSDKPSTNPRLSRLQRSSIKLLDSGRYKCVSSNEAGSAEHAAYIYVRGAPNITYFPQTLTVVQGRSLHLPCKVKGYPIPEVKWTKGLTIIPSDPRHYVSNGTLFITNVQKNDMGRYTCTATNKDGQASSATLSLTVQVLPTISPMKKYRPVDEGNGVHMTCFSSSGDQPINTYWVKDGKKLNKTSHILLGEFGGVNILQIKSVHAEDAGTYVCTANNSAGEVRETVYLFVYVPPKFTKEPSNQYVIKGQPAFLSCETTAYPPARIEWSKNAKNKGFLPVERGPRFNTLLDGTLIINNITESDEGKYLCTANNGMVGQAVSKHLFVTVHVPARIIGPPPDRSIEKNRDYSVTCVARGTLPIRLQWYNADKLLMSNSRLTTTFVQTTHLHTVNSTLHIRNLVLQDTSPVYSCRVQNDYGLDTKYFSLTVQERPKPPKRLAFEKIQARAVVVTWEPGPNGNAPLSSFHVEYKLSPDSWSIAKSNRTDGATRRLRLDNLKPASRYDVRMFAENRLGKSELSDEAVVETKEDAPSKPPIITNYTAISSREIYVEWKPPPKKDRNGEIRGYYVVCKQTNRPEDYRNITVKGGSRYSYVIRSLARYTDYKVSVQAFTRGGVSPPTDKVNCKTQEDVPSKPPRKVQVIVHSSTSMKVTWSKPLASAIHGELLGYKVNYWRADDPVQLGPIVLMGTESSVLLRNLKKYTRYKVTVLAFTRKGDGKPSDEIEKTTEEDIPGSPDNLRAIPDSKRRIRVRWNPPLEPNGIIQKYRLYYTRTKPMSRDLVGKDVIEMDISGETTSRYLNDLQAHTTYYFWVQAKTSKGYGNKTAVVEKKTRNQVPAGIYDETLSDVFEKFKKSAVLDCDTYGDPEPTIIWYSSGRAIQNNHEKYQELKNGSLVIHELKSEDSGEYECTATNSLGTKTVQRVLKVQVPPSSPRNVQFFNISSSSMNITWEPPSNTGNCEVVMYMLEYKVLEPGREWSTKYINDKRTFYILRGRLRAGRIYDVSLAAVNCVSIGEKSKKYRITFAAKGTILSVEEVDNNKESIVSANGGGLMHSSALLGTLVGISTLIVIIIILLVLLMVRGRTFKLLEDAQNFWQTRVKRRIITRNPRQIQGSSRRGIQDDRDNRHTSRSPSSEGHFADSSSSVDHLASCHSSQFSIPRSNNTLNATAHLTIPEEGVPNIQSPLGPIAPSMLSTRSRGTFNDDSFSDTSSENPREWDRLNYHRPMLHDNEAIVRARRVMGSFDSYNRITPGVLHTGTPGPNAMAYRGLADGGSEFDTTSLACGTDSRVDLRRSIGSRQSRGSKMRGLSQEIIHGSPAMGMARTRDSSAGLSRHDLARRVDSGLGPSRSDISTRQSTTGKREPLFRRANDFALSNTLPTPIQGNQFHFPNMTKDSSFPRDLQASLLTRGPRSYDSTSSEYSSSRDELVAALEYGKRNNLEVYYGKPTLETTSMSSETTNSSEQDSVCKFTSSPRPPLEGCIAPVPVRPPPYNPRSRSRGNENYVYVLDMRRRGLERDKSIRVKATEGNGSLV